MNNPDIDGAFWRQVDAPQAEERSMRIRAAASSPYMRNMTLLHDFSLAMPTPQDTEAYSGVLCDIAVDHDLDPEDMAIARDLCIKAIAEGE